MQTEYLRTKQHFEKVKNQKKIEQNEKERELALKLVPQSQASKLTESQIKNTNILKIILNNISLKLGVKNTAEIVPFLKTKLAELKISNPLKYNEILGQSSRNAV
jgi:hypothetical protein